ncbi:MAG: DUF1488 domain-containing protein, partial [Gammaproteobacteria bacterium]|nr:DUF1488 domain-containing protein [Gammaproteobacteria bacterium]
AGDGNIRFPDLQCWNPETKVVTFIAEINGERIDCKIKSSDLNKKFPTSSDDPLKAIASNKEILEEIALNKIEQKMFEINGSIKISIEDLK